MRQIVILILLLSLGAAIVVSNEVSQSVEASACAPNDVAGSWGFAQVNAAQAWARFADCSPPEIRIVVADTGVDIANEPLQDDLQGRVGIRVSFLGGFLGPDVGDVGEGSGHGTANTGIIVANRDNGTGISGIAPTSIVDSYKIKGCSFFDTVCKIEEANKVQNVADAIRSAADFVPRVRIINISAGVTDSSILRAAVDHARTKGLLIVAAVGESCELQESPLATYVGFPAAYAADYDNVIAVSASDFGGGAARAPRPGAGQDRARLQAGRRREYRSRQPQGEVIIPAMRRNQFP